MISNYNHVDQYVKLKGRQIDVWKEKVTTIFWFIRERIVPIGRKSYNPIVATYFIRNEHEHYIPHSGYLIAKANGRWKVARLEALTKIMFFRQGNKICSSCLNFNNVNGRKGEGELGCLVFLEVAKWDHCNSAHGRENWEYIIRTSFNHYWSSFLEAVGTIERKVYQDQEEDQKQGENDDVNAILLINEKKKKSKLAITTN